jgi:hypothetical protein
MASEAPMVGLCANSQNKIGPVQAVEHPARPTFFGRPGNVLIDLRVHAVLAQSLGQLQDGLRVLWRIVTVADENFGRNKGHLALENFLTDLARFVSSVAALENLASKRSYFGTLGIVPSPPASGDSEKASLISSGDHSRLETKRITALTVSL